MFVFGLIAIPDGELPTGIVAFIWLVSPSITETVSERKFVTYIVLVFRFVFIEKASLYCLLYEQIIFSFFSSKMQSFAKSKKIK